MIIDVLLKNLLNNIPHHWFYWIVLIATMLESSPIFGLIFPGQTIVIIAGFLVKLGIIDFWDTILLIFLGAVAGDLSSYFLGRKYGYSFISKYGRYFFFKKTYFEKTKEFIRKNPGKTILFGRFNSLTRAFAPFAAGTSEVNLSEFFTYTLITGILWTFCFVLIGYIFGKSYEIASRYFGGFVTLAFLISLLFVYLYRSGKKILSRKKSIFTKHNLYILITNTFSIFIFWKLVDDIVKKELITKIDLLISNKIILLWNPFLNKLMIFISWITEPEIVIVLLTTLAGIFAYKKSFHKSLFVFLITLFSGISGFLIKELVHRQRPVNSLIIEKGYSFPSGHALMSVVFFVAVIYLFKDKLKIKSLKKIYISGGILGLFVIGFNRIYLNVHWFSDVIAGFALGIFWATLMILIFRCTGLFCKVKKR